MYRFHFRRVSSFVLLVVASLLANAPLHAEYHPYRPRTSFTESTDQSPGRKLTRFWEDPDGNRGPVSAPRDTFVLIQNKWSTGSPGGWSTNDLTAQLDPYFHVDSFGAIGGSGKSLWCGTTGGGPLCHYASLPGYGNNWNQAWQTIGPVTVSGDLLLDVSFTAIFNSEPFEDVTTLEYTTDTSGLTGWTVLTGTNTGLAQWDAGTMLGNPTVTISDTYPVSGGPVLVRFRFHSGSSGSDEDGLWPSDGAVRIDDLKVEGLPLENFDSTAQGAIFTNDWQFTDPGAYGQKLGLFNHTGVGGMGGQCVDNLGYQWAAIVGTTYNFSCGGVASDPAVPFADAAGRTLNDQIISPEVLLTGTGNEFRLWLSVVPSPLDNLVFYTWRVRTNDVCGAGPWKGPGYLYYAGQYSANSYSSVGYIRQVESIGAYVDTNRPKIQLSFQVIDMSSIWSGVFGSGLCHSSAPMLGSVRLVRINSPGPQWDIRDIDQFQDTFGNLNNLSATARADMAQNIAPYSYVPGDSAVVTVFDPAGLANDLTLGGKQVYAFFQVTPFQAGKVGPPLSGGPRWPTAATLPIGSTGTWTALRLDPCVQNGAVVADRYCVDLKDALFQPGDTIQFFYGAQNVSSQVTYAFGNNLGRRGTDIVEAANNASEFTILPARAAGDAAFASDILYVDATDGRGDQSFFDDAFTLLRLTYPDQLNFGKVLSKVDRYDIRGPSSRVNNNLASRVHGGDLSLYYRRIIYDTGDLYTFNDGNLNPTEDDFTVLSDFLTSLTSNGGVYMCGDNIAEALNNSPTAGGVTLRSSFIPFTLINSDHRFAPTSFQISPKIIPWPGRNLIGDDFVLYGGCPEMHGFDVIGASGTSQVEMSYNTASNPNGAVVSNTSSSNSFARVVLSGFSFASLRDNELNGISDRAFHLYRILFFLGGGVEAFPTAVGPVVPNRLEQNHPNPFNPSTTIGFSLREGGPVSLVIYGVDGTRIRTLVDESMKPGAYSRPWDGRDDQGQAVASGVYFYKINANHFTAVKKMVLLK